MELLQRFIEDGDPMTENARYILALMLERKRQISQTAEKEVEGNKMLFYENKKTGQIFIVRDPELRLDEVAQIQEEVATILAFGGPAAEAAKVAGVTLTPHGIVPAADEAAPSGREAADATAPVPESGVEAGQNAAPATPDEAVGTQPEEEPAPESEDPGSTEDAPPTEDGPATEDAPEQPDDGKHPD